MTHENRSQDPLEMLKSMWSGMGFALPGMVTPTLDVSELDKRIADLKTVEGWLKMNLNMLQMTIQGLEVQRATLAALQTLSQAQAGATPEAAAAAAPSPFAAAAMWPWNLMQTQEGEKKDGADKAEAARKNKP